MHTSKIVPLVVVACVFLECLVPVRPVFARKRVSSASRSFERKEMERRRKKSPVYVKTLLQTPDEHGGFFAFDSTLEGNLLAGGTGGATTSDGGTKRTFGGEVILWDGKSGKLLATLGNHRGEGARSPSVNFLKFANRDRILVSASDDNLSVQVWDVRKRSRISRFTLKGSWGQKCPPTISRKGRFIANVATEEQTIDDQKTYLQGDLTVWSGRTGKPLWTAPKAAVHCLAFTTDSSRLIGAISRTEWKSSGTGLSGKTREQALAAWDTKTGKQLWKKPVKRFPTMLLASPNQPNRVFGISRSSVWGWDTSNGEVVSQVKLAIKDRVSLGHIALSHDSSALVIVDFMEQKIAVYDFQTGQELHRGEVKFPNRLGHSAFTANLERMVCNYGMGVGPSVIEVDELTQTSAP